MGGLVSNLLATEDDEQKINVLPKKIDPHYPIINLSQTRTTLQLEGLPNLPKDIIYVITTFLSDKDLLSVSISCKSVYFTLSEDAFWEKRMESLMLRNEISSPNAKPKYQYFWIQYSENVKKVVDIDNYEFTRYKCVILGQNNTGKRQLGRSLAFLPFEDKTTDPLPTAYFPVGWKYKMKCYLLDIFSKSPTPWFDEYYPSPHHVKSTTVSIVVYSAVNQSTFDEIDELIQFAEFCGGAARTILVSTHNDLRQSATEKMVPSKSGKNLANKYKIPFVQVSTKTGEGIAELRKTVLEEAFKVPPPVEIPEEEYSWWPQ